MAEKRLYGRIVHKHDTQSHWENATDFVPMMGEIIIYDVDENYDYERMKIGDGETVVGLLPFISAEDSSEIIIDDELSATSVNPVQNKVIAEALDTLIGDIPVQEQITTAISNKADDDHEHTAAEVGADVSGAAASALSEAKSYTDTKTDGLVAASALTSHTEDTENPHDVTKAQLGLGNVENKSSATIRGELTNENVISALGYASETTGGAMSAADKQLLNELAEFVGDKSVDEKITDAIAGKAPTSHASTATTYGAASASNYGHAKASSTTPKAPGTAAVGSETSSFSRGDHIHPLQASEYGINTTGSGSAYIATVPEITALRPGIGFIMIPHVQSTTAAPTLNVNGLGAKTLIRRKSSGSAAVDSGYNTKWLSNLTPYKVIYDGTDWIVEGVTRPVADDLSGTVPVLNGGTGATDAQTARINLGITPANIGAATQTAFNALSKLVGDEPVADQISAAMTNFTPTLSSLGIPQPTRSDYGKFLRVNSSGSYTLETISYAEEVSF